MVLEKRLNQALKTGFLTPKWPL